MTVITIILLGILVAAYKEAGDRSKIIRAEMLKGLN